VSDREMSVEGTLRSLARFVLRDNVNFRIVVVSLIFDIVFTFGIGYTTVHLHDLTVDYQHSTCRASNHLRTAERRVWSYVLRTVTPAHPTAAQAAELRHLTAYVDRTMAGPGLLGVIG